VRIVVHVGAQVSLTVSRGSTFLSPEEFKQNK
jgi:hypothetical protein